MLLCGNHVEFAHLWNIKGFLFCANATMHKDATVRRSKRGNPNHVSVALLPFGGERLGNVGNLGP